MNALVAAGFFVAYLVSIFVAVSSSHGRTIGRAMALLASSAPYAVATVYAFVTPVPNSLEDVWRALAFAMAYVVLTAILVYSVKKQWAQPPD